MWELFQSFCVGYVVSRVVFTFVGLFLAVRRARKS